MSDVKAGALVGAIVLTGESIAGWMSDHREFLIAAGIVGFSVLLYASVAKSNAKTRNQ